MSAFIVMRGCTATCHGQEGSGLLLKRRAGLGAAKIGGLVSASKLWSFLASAEKPQEKALYQKTSIIVYIFSTVIVLLSMESRVIIHTKRQN